MDVNCCDHGRDIVDSINEWPACALPRLKPSPLTLAFSSRRVRVSGRIGDCGVPSVTIETATASLKATDGTTMEVLGFVRFGLQLEDVSRKIEVLSFHRYTLMEIYC